MKTCSKCKRGFPATLEFFHKNKLGKYGLNSKCKECKSQYQQDNREHRLKYFKQWYQDNKEQIAEQHRQYRKDNREKVYAKNAKLRAIKKGAKVGETFTRQDVLDKWGTDCHICKEPIDVLDWHMDHVIPLKPRDKKTKPGEHSLANVKPSHPKCNLEKSNG